MFPLGWPTHWKACWLKSFYLNFRSKFFFISDISGPFPSSLFPFLHSTITGNFCWYDCGNGKKTFWPTYLPCFWRVGQPRGNIHIFKCGLDIKFSEHQVRSMSKDWEAKQFKCLRAIKPKGLNRTAKIS